MVPYWKTGLIKTKKNYSATLKMKHKQNLLEKKDR